MQDLSFAIVDLEWYFQQSCADCGVSSAQGYFLDVAKLGHWIHSGHSQLLLEQERVVGAIARRKVLSERLARLTPDQCWTLALGFATPARLPDRDGVAVTLIADTKAAQTARQQMRLKPVKPGKKSSAPFAECKFLSGSRFDTFNTREFVSWLFATRATQKQNLKSFNAALAEARERLDGAIAAFCATELEQ